MRPSLLVQPQEDLRSSQGTDRVIYQCLVPGHQESRCGDAVSHHKRSAPAGENDPTATAQDTAILSRSTGTVRIKPRWQVQTGK